MLFSWPCRFWIFQDMHWSICFLLKRRTFLFKTELQGISIVSWQQLGLDRLYDCVFQAVQFSHNNLPIPPIYRCPLEIRLKEIRPLFLPVGSLGQLKIRLSLKIVVTFVPNCPSLLFLDLPVSQFSHLPIASMQLIALLVHLDTWEMLSHIHVEDKICLQFPISSHTFFCSLLLLAADL